MYGSTYPGVESAKVNSRGCSGKASGAIETSVKDWNKRAGSETTRPKHTDGTGIGAASISAGAECHPSPRTSANTSARKRRSWASCAAPSMLPMFADIFVSTRCFLYQTSDSYSKDDFNKGR